MIEKPTRGGKREGAGRKPTGKLRTETLSVRLASGTLIKLETITRGNRSRTIERLIEEEVTRSGPLRNITQP